MRGRRLSSALTFSKIPGPGKDNSVLFGQYSRSSPSVFSLRPRCYGDRRQVQQHRVTAVRSPRVPIADLDAVEPMIRSPSQGPGTARSSMSAGRSEIITISRNRRGRAPSGCSTVSRPATCSGLNRSVSIDLTSSRHANPSNFRDLGRRARVHVCSCASGVTYRSMAWFLGSFRLIVDGARLSSVAMRRNPRPCASWKPISSRSRND